MNPEEKLRPVVKAKKGQGSLDPKRLRGERLAYEEGYHPPEEELDPKRVAVERRMYLEGMEAHYEAQLEKSNKS